MFGCEGGRGPSRLQARLHPLSSGPWSSHTIHANHRVPFTDGSTEAWAQIHSSGPPGGEPGRCREEGPSPPACAAVSKGWGNAARGDGGWRGAAAPASWRSLNSCRGEDGQASRQNASMAPWSPFAQLGQRLHFDERSHRDRSQGLFGGLGKPGGNTAAGPRSTEAVRADLEEQKRNSGPRGGASHRLILRP